jgi:hypothetical protein
MMQTVAALSFNSPIMLLGLLAAGIPVVLHLLNRVRSPIVPFPTLRFLKITAMKTSRRRQLQHWLLLLLRMAVFAVIAAGVAQPQVWGGSSAVAYGLILAFLAGIGLLAYAILRMATGGKGEADEIPDDKIVGQHAEPKARQGHWATNWGLSAAAMLAAILLLAYSAFGLGTDTFFSGPGSGYSGNSTAAVIILDDSHSMLARLDSASRLQRAKDQVRQLLLDTIKPAEAALIATNPGTANLEDNFTTNMNEILGTMDQLQPLGKAKPMRDRVRTAATAFTKTSQPNKMLIIISDMARTAFSDPDIFEPIKDIPDLQVVLMPMANGTPPADVGIVSFNVSSGQAVIGNEIVFDAQVLNNADAADVRDLELLVDDQLMPTINPRVQLGPAGSGGARASIKVPFRVGTAGIHRFTLRLKNSNDAMAWDDKREVVLNVADQVKVLVVGPEAKLRSRSTAYFVETALNPFAGSAGKTAWGIDPAYRGVDEANNEALNSYSAIFVCDVPKIPPAFADALQKYAEGGGRICWLLGPSVNGGVYNADLIPRGLLPGQLTSPLVSAVGANVDWVDTEADVFSNLFDSQEPFRQIVVTGRWGLAGNRPQRGRVLGKLSADNGDNPIFITEHVLGDKNGEIYTILTANTADWSNMGTTVTFLPMLVRIAMGDLQHVKNTMSAEPGSRIDIAPPTQDGKVSIDVIGPAGGAPVNVRAENPQNPKWYFDRTLQAGIYLWHSADTRFSGQFVINPPSEEVDLFPSDPEALGRGMHTKLPAVVAHNAAELLASLQSKAEASTLAPGMIALVLILAVLEALFSNRYKPSVANKQVPQSHPEPGPPGPPSSGKALEALSSAA